ncbi:hypothetical protein NQ314_021041 [Rhamnusium bicolor]|uniref:Uncharacterized protein n=1 Tax=Rhamnusium bicolor TaxID=1586634 RepID=A0AAV8WLC4_9CUCU|nr:hypothetical protein NQ314_021041 [Rhamnusium bicolor]
MANMADQLKTLKAKRAVIKASLTRFETTFLNKFVAEQNIDFISLKARLVNIQPLLDELNNIQFDIEILTAGDDELVIQSDEREYFEECYYRLISTAKQHISSSHKLESLVSNDTDSNGSVKSIVQNTYKGVNSLPSVNETAGNKLLMSNINEAPSAVEALWWHGPQRLLRSDNEWKRISHTKLSIENLPELRPNSVVFFTTSKTDFKNFPQLTKYSSFSRLQRVFSYVLRFINNIKNTSKYSGPLSSLELNHSLYHLTKIVQNESFALEMQEIRKNGQVSPKSNLLNLNPFIDEKDILRVGGRLKKSNFDYEKKHPALLPKGHTFSTLIAQQEHLRLLHAGPQHLLASLRERFWPLAGRNLAQISSSCNMQSHADDSLSFELESSQQASQLINDDLGYLINIVMTIRLKLNLEKCKVMQFCSKYKYEELKHKTKIKIGNEVIDFIDQARNLGSL